MGIKERLAKRRANSERIAAELNQVNTQIEDLSKKRNQLIQEAIGNNEAIKELMEIEAQNKE